MFPLTLGSPQCSSLCINPRFTLFLPYHIVPHDFSLVVSLCSVPCFLLYSLQILPTSSFFLSPPTQFCCLQPVFPCTFSFMLKVTYISQFCHLVASLEVRHPRCVGSITKNFVYYTYSQIQLYFTC